MALHTSTVDLKLNNRDSQILRDEWCYFLACVKWSHFDMGHPPVGPSGRLQNLVMLLQDLPEACDVQVLQTQRGRGEGIS